MRSFFRYFFLIVFSLIWLVGCSGTLAKFLLEHHLVADDYRYGDLYRFANLPQFRVPIAACKTTKQPKIKDLSLLVIGDSFTEAERITADDFLAERYQRFFITQNNYVALDKNKYNVLLIETVERHIRERFANPYKSLIVLDKQSIKPQKTIPSLLDYNMPYKEERLESAVFGYDFFEKIKELKACFNYIFLSKVDDNVSLSADKRVLLYSLDTKPGINSCFDEIKLEEIDKIIENIAITEKYYQSLGFDKVIISFVPNKTSLYASDLGNYNHLVERVQQRLKTPYINVFDAYHSSTQMLYESGDSHWNCAGRQIWIDKVNAQLNP